MKHMIGIIGAESTGKSTLALMLTGRLRTHGLEVVLSAEAGAARPFPAEMLDDNPAAHFYTVAQKIAAESHAMLRPNAEYIVSDRTPLDLAAYFLVREQFKDVIGARSLEALAIDWMKNYDAIYYLPTAGTTYVDDGYRAKAGVNTWRGAVDLYLSLKAPELGALTVTGTPRERCEWVYHHVLHKFLGKTRPLRAYTQVRKWLEGRGWDIKEVRPQGSNSITRFHPSTDTDDIDAMIVVDGGVEYAIQVRTDIEAHRTQLENIVQADLDLLVTPAGLEAHEV